jgi:hydroxyethylthiazole kinase-like uncharacterized protein yjeF
MPHPITPGPRLPLHDVSATRALELAAAARLAPHTLMQRAGLATARLALALAPHARRVWIACGPGNNGGDGLEAAMHLQHWGLAPLVTWLGEPGHLPTDAEASWQRARAAGVRFVEEPPDTLEASDLCIDALLGIGAARAPSGRLAEWLGRLRRSPATLLCVDLPTGLDADTGVDHGAAAVAIPAIPALAAPDPAPGPSGPRHTLSLLTLKPGLFTAQGRDACGRIWFHDLGVESESAAPAAWLNPAPPARARPHASHKGRFGDVAIVGGEGLAARGMAMGGAVLLAAGAALHGGAGRVLACPLDPEAAALDSHQPELMFRRWPALAPGLEKLTVVCGCGGGEAVFAVLPRILRRAARLVLDADALNAIAGMPDWQALLRGRAGAWQPTVLTPHPLEAARLLGTSTQAVQADRLAAARELATRLQATVVLKGSGSVIAAPGQAPHLNPTGNARLASAGTGDVLAGLLGALLASGRPAFEAACDAVYQHGAVADRWPAGTTLTAGALARSLTP